MAAWHSKRRSGSPNAHAQRLHKWNSTACCHTSCQDHQQSSYPVIPDVSILVCMQLCWIPQPRHHKTQLPCCKSLATNTNQIHTFKVGVKQLPQYCKRDYQPGLCTATISQNMSRRLVEAADGRLNHALCNSSRITSQANCTAMLRIDWPQTIDSESSATYQWQCQHTLVTSV